MKRARPLALSALLLSAGLATSASALVVDYVWTGIGNGWKNQVVPPGDGSAALVFGEAMRQEVFVADGFIVDSLHFLEDDRFKFLSAGPATLTILNGIDASEAFFARGDLASSITVNLPQAQTWDLGQGGAATLHGKLTGAGNLTILGGTGALILDNQTGTPSDFSGTLTLSPSSTAQPGTTPTLAIWGANSVGSGAIHFTNGGGLTTHGAPTLANNFVLGAGPLQGGQIAPYSLRFRQWDGPTTLTGNILLANNTTLQALNGWENKREAHFPNNTGALPLPGPITRHPLVISGNISDNAQGFGLHVTGPGVIILSGTNDYSAGTYVGFPVGGSGNAGGSLVFGSLSAIPANGLVQPGPLNASGAGGYAGIAVSALGVPGTFQDFLDNKVNPAASGAVGVDTLPGEGTQTFADDIDLSLFSTSAANGIRLGTATSAILTGTITPQHYYAYHFGNGGGKLTVQSDLMDIDGTALIMSNNGYPLELHLQGNNTYFSGTTVNAGILVFDTASSVPASGSLRAGGAADFTGQSYIGIHAGAEMSAGTFLGKFDQTNTWGTVGFDGGMTITNLDLTGFNDGVYVGTASSAILTGTITPTSVANAENAPDTLRLTAAAGGTLHVQSTLADGGQPRAVIIGVPVPTSMSKMSDGTVSLLGANTYTGGTTIHGSGGITVAAGHNSAFGSGPVTFSEAGGLIGLSASAGGLTLSNDLVFATPTMGGTASLFLTGAFNFTLAGNISGPPASSTMGLGSISLADPLDITLTGDNSGFHGYFSLKEGKLHFDSNNAAGQGAVRFNGPDGIVAFNTSGGAPNPVLYGLGGEGGTVVLPDGTNLTINLDNPNADYDFGGVITGPLGPTNASLVVTGTGLPDGDDVLYLYGSNQFSGGTTILGEAALGLGHASSAGSGLITIDAANGGLLLNSNVTLTNPLVLTAGGIGGLGTFAPSSFNGTPGGPIVIGAGQLFLPGIPGENMIPGTLTFAADTVFGNGGRYQWLLQDPNDPEAFSLLNITGTLDLNGLSAGGFTLELETLDADGHENSFASTLAMDQTYSLTLLTAAGGILGFDAADFLLDVSRFQLGGVPLENFSLSADTNNIYLTFTPVPEPSTWVLMISGAAFLGLTWFRRRRV